MVAETLTTRREHAVIRNRCSYRPTDTFYNLELKSNTLKSMRHINTSHIQTAVFEPHPGEDSARVFQEE